MKRRRFLRRLGLAVLAVPLALFAKRVPDQRKLFRTSCVEGGLTGHEGAVGEPGIPSCYALPGVGAIGPTGATGPVGAIGPTGPSCPI